ncbi:MAG: NAD-dependent epimerase/dehydratase family protein [Chloroflexi bacterium]|nr:NAD-dependent epimerase/dehydratase family protein [Chloroflexota bacterium]
MRILITGAGGFVGGHLVDHLSGQPEYELFAAVFLPPGQNSRLDGRPIAQHHVDLRAADQVRAVLDTVRPDWVFHLAALADVGQSFKDPWHTLENNSVAQINLLQALLGLELDARLLVVSSGEIYGANPTSDPLGEDAPFMPASPYSVSKVTQDMLALQYYLSHSMAIVRARPFNHIGPSQAGGFVAADFASQIAAIEAERQEPVMYVGNLTAERDFTDVRDVVRAYRLLLERGEPGAAYNVCSGTAFSIQYLLDTLLGYSPVEIEVRQDPARMRPSDIPRRVGNAALLREATGWQPTIPFEQTLLDILNDWRVRMGVTPSSHQE